MAGVSFRTAALLLAAALFLRMLGVFILLPLAAPLVAALPHGSPLAAGLVLGGYGITQAAAQIPVGMLADKFGKKPVMLGALAVFALGGLAAAQAESTAALVAGRLLQGAGAVAAVSAAWMADIAPPGRRAPAMALFGVVIALAFLLALLIAPPVAAQLQLGGVFLLSGGLGAAAFACVLLLPAPLPPASAVPLRLRAVLADRKVQHLAAGAGALHFALAAVLYIASTTLPLPLAAHWLAYAPALLLAAAPAWWLIKRAERQTARCLLLSVFSISAALLLLFFFGAGLLFAGVAALCLFFIGFVALEAAIPALTAKAVPAQQRASAMGVVMTSQFAGIFLGGLAAGAFGELAHNASAFVAVGLFGWWGWRGVQLYGENMGRGSDS